MRVLLLIMSLLCAGVLSISILAPHFRPEPTLPLLLPVSSQNLIDPVPIKVSDGQFSYTDYRDQDFGFRMAVPEGWSRIIIDDPDGNPENLPDGYAVGFESAPESPADHFRDYIMVELLPARGKAAFSPDPEAVRWGVVDGVVARLGELTLPKMPLTGGDIELQVWQAELPRAGYTIGLYAIGEQRNAPTLKKAFNALLHTFELPDEPFMVL